MVWKYKTTFNIQQYTGNNGHSLYSRKVLSLIEAYTFLSSYASVPPVVRSSMEGVFMCADVLWSDSELYFAQKLQQSRMKGLWCKKWISAVAIAASFWMIQILAHKLETWSWCWMKSSVYFMQCYCLVQQTWVYRNFFRKLIKKSSRRTLLAECRPVPRPFLTPPPQEINLHPLELTGPNSHGYVYFICSKWDYRPTEWPWKYPWQIRFLDAGQSHRIAHKVERRHRRCTLSRAVWGAVRKPGAFLMYL